MMISHLTPYTNLFFLLFLFTDDPTYFIDIRVVKEKFHIFLPTDLPIYLQLYPYTGEGNVIFLSREGRDLGVAFQAPPASQASSRGEAKDSALLSSRDAPHSCAHTPIVCVRSLVFPWTIAWQAPLFVEFPRQEYWSGWPFPSPGDLPDPGIRSSALQAASLLSEPPGMMLSNHFICSLLLQLLPPLAISLF